MKKNNLFKMVGIVAAAAIVCAGCGKSKNEVAETSASAPAANDEIVTESSFSEEEMTIVNGIIAGLDMKFDENLSGVEDFLSMKSKSAESTVEYSESLTSAYNDKLQSADSFYSVLKDGTSCSVVASEGANSNVTLLSDMSAAIIIIRGGVAHSFEPTQKTGYTITLDADTLSSFTKSELVTTVFPLPEDKSARVRTYPLELGGKKYTYELFENFGYVYDEAGQLLMRCDASGNFAADFRINEVPAGVFDDPQGYVISDYDELISKISESVAAESEQAQQ